MSDKNKELEYMIAFFDGALAAGDKVVIADQEMARDTRRFLEELRQHRADDKSRDGL